MRTEIRQKSQTLSLETEKTFDTIQYAFVGKVLDKLVTNRMYLKIIEVIYNTHSQQYILRHFLSNLEWDKGSRWISVQSHSSKRREPCTCVRIGIIKIVLIHRPCDSILTRPYRLFQRTLSVFAECKNQHRKTVLLSMQIVNLLRKKEEKDDPIFNT